MSRWGGERLERQHCHRRGKRIRHAVAGRHSDVTDVSLRKATSRAYSERIGRLRRRFSSHCAGGSPDRLQAGLNPGPQLLGRSEEHTSELQSRLHLVCRLLLEKKKTKIKSQSHY